ncbi:3-oxoacyl-ACP synthase [Fulvivirga lutea]|uniref:3-oxoacyl-ACP synthase n=1 Tax=Fulvivirga lutea TaxID=2810512 RepID=A0A974WHB5_9BACT|nr:3-oxoacyl-ACP synthase [Fulvivirga lutea]QSE97127.1 3-oxoacyl-ACP synthase [Fulvivirga lutea]
MKKQVLAACKQAVTSKLADLKNQIKDLQESANEDSKSAMGDKYETGRAMVHLEQENLMTRYTELSNQLEILNALTTEDTKIIQNGSLIITDMGIFYMSIGLGKIDIENSSVFAIAPNSPIGQELIGKSAGMNVTVNGRTYNIKDVK